MLNAYYAYINAGKDQNWCYKNYVNHKTLRSADSVREQLLQMMQGQFKVACLLFVLFAALPCRTQTSHACSCPQLPIVSTDFSNRAYYTNIQRAILAGYFMHVAHLERSQNYLTIRDDQVGSFSVRCVALALCSLSSSCPLPYPTVALCIQRSRGWALQDSPTFRLETVAEQIKTQAGT
jgi:hypothetical protein